MGWENAIFDEFNYENLEKLFNKRGISKIENNNLIPFSLSIKVCTNFLFIYLLFV